MKKLKVLKVGYSANDGETAYGRIDFVCDTKAMKDILAGNIYTGKKDKVKFVTDEECEIIYTIKWQ